MQLKNGNVQHNLTQSEARKGGQNSGKARREKKTVRMIVDALMETKIEKAPPQMAKLAAKLGISEKKNVKELFALVCLINSMKEGDLGDLEKLTGLLGEQIGGEKKQDNGILDQLASYLGQKDGDSNA